MGGQVPDEPANDGDYRTARQLSAGMLTALVGLLVVADVLGISARPVDPVVLGALLITSAGLLSVDLPSLRR